MDGQSNNKSPILGLPVYDRRYMGHKDGYDEQSTTFCRVSCIVLCVAVLLCKNG